MTSRCLCLREGEMLCLEENGIVCLEEGGIVSEMKLVLF